MSHRVLWAFGLACCLAAASCTKSGVETSRGGVTIEGAGATFPANLYQKWFVDYHAAHPETTVRYLSMGSGAGFDLFAQGKVDFGASDVAMDDSTLERIPGGANAVPTTAAAIVLAYNIPGLTTPLKLTRETYAGIFLGTITNWNDPAIAASNPDGSLPDLKIETIHRQAASGTTHVFTQHLSAVSEAWSQGPGQGMSVVWPNGKAARNSDDMADLIQKESGSIGYLDFGHAASRKLSVASLQNKAGRYVAPSRESSIEALESTPIADNTHVASPDPKGEAAYPIVTYTWLLVRKQYADARKAVAVKGLLKHCLTDGQNDCEPLGLIPLPDSVRQAGLASLDAMNR